MNETEKGVRGLRGIQTIAVSDGLQSRWSEQKMLAKNSRQTGLLKKNLHKRQTGARVLQSTNHKD